MAVPHDTIAALVLLEDVTKEQFRLERVFKDRADVLAQDDEAHQAEREQESPLLLQELAHTLCGQRRFLA